MSISVTYQKTGGVIVAILDEELRAEGIQIDGVSWHSALETVRVDYQDSATPEQMAQGETIVAAHVPVDLVQEVQDGAETAVLAIPEWAHWTEAQVIAWWETHVHAPLVTGRANLPTTLTLASTRLVILALLNILDSMATMLWAMARMIVAMRNHNWPNLQDGE